MLTEVDLLHLPGVAERWVRFGRWTGERILDRRRRVLSFAPGEIFALVRWRAGEYGTAESRLDIVRAVRPGEAMVTVPFVAPGGELLCRLAGWPKVERALQAIDQVEALGVAPQDACPDHWRHVENRFLAGLPARRYTRLRHTAWRLRARVRP